MPPPSPPDKHYAVTFLLTEVVALLTRELTIVAHHRWEDLPGHKKEKVVLACRLESIDWAPEQIGEEPPNWRLLKSRIADLEDECRQKIQVQIELICKQILSLQDLHQYLRECLSISFRNFHEPVPVA